ncbi:MAG: prolipoprotein diacylglyceryl transferase [bacterium]|nr:prolipoprotein diacylglyceryl transferase [bacterium]
MKNELLKIGPFTIYGYGLMIAIGVLAAYVMAERRAKKDGLRDDLVFGLVIWCLFGGLIGAKVLYIITQFKDILDGGMSIIKLANGFVVYGGIIGGTLGGFLFCKVKKIDFLKYFDLAMPSVALAQAFGRIGCLLAGCCYGKETHAWYGITFRNSELAPNGVSLVPTQIISSGLDFLLCIVLVLFARRKKADGQVGALYLMLYSVGRFILEYYRGDLIRGSVGQLSTSQFISIFLFVAGAAVFAVCGMRKQKQTAEL